MKNNEIPFINDNAMIKVRNIFNHKKLKRGE